MVIDMTGRNVPHPNTKARNRACKRLELEFPERFQQLLDEERARKITEQSKAADASEKKPDEAQA